MSNISPVPLSWSTAQYLSILKDLGIQVLGYMFNCLLQGMSCMFEPGTSKKLTL